MTIFGDRKGGGYHCTSPSEYPSCDSALLGHITVLVVSYVRCHNVTPHDVTLNVVTLRHVTLTIMSQIILVPNP